MAADPTLAPEGIPGSALPGPFPVGGYAAKMRSALRARPRLQLFGEVWNLKPGRARVWFELRDATGALPCSMWRDDFDALGLAPGALADGSQVVVAGGPDYYPGSRTASPSFSFSVAALRVAGEGDLLAQLDRLRKVLAGEGLLAPQKALVRPALPRCIGVVTAEGGKARDDVLAGLRRRGWAGRLVWAFAPVQDRHAAPAVTRALQDLAASGAVDVIVVARGGGSLADLFCFCDETLCRTVALLPVPVIASVGHHTDRTLLDDVAAVSCSTPTHAAETAVAFEVAAAREGLVRAARRLDQHGRAAILTRARALAALSRAPARYVARERERLHQRLREIRAAAARRVESERRHTGRRALVLARKSAASDATHAAHRAALHRRAATLARTSTDARTRRLDALAATLAAHDPQRTLERGYALVADAGGAPLTSAAAARAAGAVTLRFADGAATADVRDAPAPPPPHPSPPAPPVPQPGLFDATEEP